MKSTELLDKWDVLYTPRVKDGIKYIDNVCLPLTFVEWGHLCMNEGDCYLGGCCSKLSYAQDILNNVFRKSGWIRCDLFRVLVELTTGHEGFSCLEDVKLLELESLDELEGKHPFEKISAVWLAVKDDLAVDSTMELPSPVDTVEAHVAYELSKNLGELGWKSLFSWGEDECTKQVVRSRLVARAKVLAAMKMLYNELQGKAEEPLPGFGIRERESKECASNGYGLCLYETREKAQETLDTWKRGKKYGEDFDETEWEIVPCVVTLENGLQWEE